MINDDNENGNDEFREGLKISDIIKRVVSVGVGAAFMTEDSVKALLSELPLPKDIINGLVQNAKGAKEEFLESIQTELRRHLSSIDPKLYIEEILSNYEFEIDARIRLHKRDDLPSSGKSKSGKKSKKKKS